MKLSNENIDKLINDIEDFFKRARVSQNDTVKLCLLIEEALLQYQAKFGENYEFNFKMRKILSAMKIIIRVKGEPLNPLKIEDNEFAVFNASIMKNLLNYERAQTTYRYENGYNEIVVSSEKERKQTKVPGGQVTFSILAAIICAFGINFLPGDIQVAITENLTPTLIKISMDVIVAVTGPFVFVSIIAGILALGNVKTLSNVGLRVIKRFFIISAAVGIITAIVSNFFYDVITFEGKATVKFSEIFSMLISVIPTNLFEPFVKGAILQIVLISIFVGICVLILENFTPNVRNILNELNHLVTKMFEVVSHIIILTIFLCIFKMLTTTSLEKIAEVWTIIAVNYIVFAIMSLAMISRLYVKYKINIRDFLKKLSSLLVTSFTTASNTIAMPLNFEVALQKLEIEEKFCNFWLPLSYSFLAPGATLGLVLSVFYTANFHGLTISIVQVIMTIFLALQLSLTTPPVAGGIMSIYAMILGQMNLPTDTIAALMMASVFVLNTSAAVNTIIRNCELMDVSRQIKLDDNGDNENG